MPALSDEDSFYLRVFWDLSTCRQIGFAAGPIPHRAIKDEARDYGLDAEATAIFIAVIRMMDRVFLEWCQEEREANKP